MPPRCDRCCASLGALSRETYIPQGIIPEQPLKSFVVFFCNSLPGPGALTQIRSKARSQTSCPSRSPRLSKRVALRSVGLGM